MHPACSCCSATRSSCSDHSSYLQLLQSFHQQLQQYQQLLKSQQLLQPACQKQRQRSEQLLQPTCSCCKALISSCSKPNSYYSQPAAAAVPREAAISSAVAAIPTVIAIQIAIAACLKLLQCHKQRHKQLLQPTCSCCNHSSWYSLAAGSYGKPNIPSWLAKRICYEQYIMAMGGQTFQASWPKESRNIT